MEMKHNLSFLIKVLALQCLAVLCASQDFDFFYLVQQTVDPCPRKRMQCQGQWPGSYCDSKQGCCYPRTGKPASDFSIHGLWPNYNDGSYPSNCDPQAQFNPSQISDLTSRMQKDWPSLSCPSSDGLSFWSHEWEKHGTCSESILDQHDYFASALLLKRQSNLLQILKNAGIQPNGQYYCLDGIKAAIRGGIGYTPYIECNVDPSGNSQLYQIYVCVDTSGSNLIECPVLPRGKCGSRIEFPSF